MSINLTNVFYTYMTGTPFERQALNDVSVSIEKGEILAIIGHTGSGKSTLVQHLNGLLKPSSGKVTIDDIDISGRGGEAKKARQQVGMVFQYPEHQIFAETVYEDIALVLVIVALVRKKLISKYTKQWLSLVWTLMPLLSVLHFN